MASTPPNDTNNTPQPTALLDSKYRVERVIGEGAFGRVYLAQDTRLRRPVAIKELLASRNATDPEVYARYLDRFGREARAGGAVTHPNVVTVYEMAIDNDQNTYLVMEYVDGTNLRDLLAQIGTLPTERAVAIALDIARGLEAVHEADIVHRDLKPANIMISRRGGAKVGDFGIAQVGTESQRTQVAVGHPGTPLYMSPEQASGYGYIDGRSDLYSLGLIIYEMLVGEPYARRRVPLAQAKPNTPPALVAIVERLIEKNPDQRFQSASDTIVELGRLSTAPQQPSASGAYGFASGQPLSYPQGAPAPQSGYAPPAPGAPQVYGGPPALSSGYASGPPMQPPPGYGSAAATGGYPQQPPPPPQSQMPAYGQPGGPPPGVAGTQQMQYNPPPGGPPPKRGGMPPAAIGGIIAGVVLVAAVVAIIALGGRGGGTATATVGATATTVASAATTAPITSATSTTSATAASTTAAATAARTPTTAASATPSGATASARPSGTPSGTPSASASTTRVANGTSYPGSTPFPTASNKVKLNPGKALPAAALPQVYVDTDLRYTLRFPKEWNEEPGDADTDVQFSLGGTTIAGVTTENLNGEKKPSVQQIADQLFDTFSKQLTNFKMTDATQVKVGSQDAVRMLYTFTDKGNTVTLGGYLVAYSTDTTLVLLSCYDRNDTFTAKVPTFDNVAATLTGGFDLPNTYNDTQNRFTFTYPKAWAERKSSVSSVVVLVAPDGGTPSFNVVSASAGGRSLQQYYDANVRGIADPSTGLKGYKKISETDTSVYGQPAKMQVYTADLDGNGSVYELTQWYIIKENTGYVLTYSVQQSKAAENAGVGPAIVSTVTFS